MARSRERDTFHNDRKRDKERRERREQESLANPGPTLHALDGSEPHKDYGGWRAFLALRCEVRDRHDGVTFYGATNCNYIVFPCGTIVENFGYHGRALMSRIREDGKDAVMADIQATLEKIRQCLDN